MGGNLVWFLLPCYTEGDKKLKKTPKTPQPFKFYKQLKVLLNNFIFQFEDSILV